MQVPLPEEEAAKQAAKPERLAIGGEGGFQTEASKFTLSKAHTLVVLPEMLSVPSSAEPQVGQSMYGGMISLRGSKSMRSSGRPVGSRTLKYCCILLL